MEAETVILGMYSFLITLVAWMFYLSDKDLREHGQKLIKENEEMKAENEESKKQFEKEIKFLEKNIDISNQLDRMNNLLELEMKYIQEYKRLMH